MVRTIKPQSLKEQDSYVTTALNIAWVMFPEDEVDYDYGRQRIFLQDRLTAHKLKEYDELQFRLDALDQTIVYFGEAGAGESCS